MPVRVQPGHRLETGQPPLIKQGQEKRLHRIVKVVSQGDLIQPQILHGVVDGPTAHLGAHGTRVLLSAQIKNNVKDLRLQQVVGYLQLPAQSRHRRKVHLRHSRVDGDGMQLKGQGLNSRSLAMAYSSVSESFPPDTPTATAVSGLDHIIVLDASAQMGKYLLHIHSSNAKIKNEYSRDYKRIKEISLEFFVQHDFFRFFG